MDIFYPLYPASWYIRFITQKSDFHKNVQFQLYQWQASGTEHTDKQAKKVIILFLLDMHTVTLQSPFYHLIFV